MRVIWQDQAIQDLRHLRAYIESHNPAAAQRVAERITCSLSLLADSPGIGRKGRVAGTRELVIQDTPYIAVYTLHPQTVEILALFHTARKWPDEFTNLH